MINNFGFNPLTAPHVPLETSHVSRGEAGSFFAHHPYLCFFKGRFFAMYSSGVANEDDFGQTVCLRSSLDFHIWSQPTCLRVSGTGTSVDTACGFFVDHDILYALIGSYEYDCDSIRGDGKRPPSDSCHSGTALFMMTSQDGVSFSKPVKTNLKMVPNMEPKIMKNGEVVICGNFSMALNRHFSADPFSFLKVSLNPKFEIDDSSTFRDACRFLPLDTDVCEADIYESLGGYTSFFRSQRKEAMGWIYSSFSSDLRNWDLPKRTAFTNDTSKFCVGNLPSGSIFCVSNPVVGSGRNPLVLSLSSNGVDFDRFFIIKDQKINLRNPGFAKFGTYAYPSSLIHNGFLYIIYSINKEDIDAVRIPINQIEAGGSES